MKDAKVQKITFIDSKMQALSRLQGVPEPKQKSIMDRNINKTKNSDVALSSFSFLFSEQVQHLQKNVKGIQDLEKRSIYLTTD